MDKVDPRVRKAPSKKARVGASKADLRGKSSGVAEAKVPDAELNVGSNVEMKAGPDYFGNRIEGIESRLKIIDDKIMPVELRSIEHKALLERVNEISLSQAMVEKEFHVMTTLLKVVLGVGSVGALLMVVAILRFTHYI